MRRRPILIQIALGIVRAPRTRRSAMFFLLLGALALLFLGATWLDRFLAAHPLAFLAHWSACACLTLSAALLALYDMLAIQAAARETRRQLRRRVLGADGGAPTPHSSDNPPRPAGGASPP